MCSSMGDCQGKAVQLIGEEGNGLLHVQPSSHPLYEQLKPKLCYQRDLTLQGAQVLQAISADSGAHVLELRPAPGPAGSLHANLSQPGHQAALIVQDYTTGDDCFAVLYLVPTLKGDTPMFLGFVIPAVLPAILQAQQQAQQQVSVGQAAMQQQPQQQTRQVTTEVQCAPTRPALKARQQHGVLQQDRPAKRRAVQLEDKGQTAQVACLQELVTNLRQPSQQKESEPEHQRTHTHCLSNEQQQQQQQHGKLLKLSLVAAKGQLRQALRRICHLEASQQADAVRLQQAQDQVAELQQQLQQHSSGAKQPPHGSAGSGPQETQLAEQMHGHEKQGTPTIRVVEGQQGEQDTPCTRAPEEQHKGLDAQLPAELHSDAEHSVQEQVHHHDMPQLQLAERSTNDEGVQSQQLQQLQQQVHKLEEAGQEANVQLLIANVQVQLLQKSEQEAKEQLQQAQLQVADLQQQVAGLRKRVQRAENQVTAQKQQVDALLQEVKYKDTVRDKHQQVHEHERDQAAKQLQQALQKAEQLTTEYQSMAAQLLQTQQLADEQAKELVHARQQVQSAQQQTKQSIAVAFAAQAQVRQALQRQLQAGDQDTNNAASADMQKAQLQGHQQPVSEQVLQWEGPLQRRVEPCTAAVRSQPVIEGQGGSVQELLTADSVPQLPTAIQQVVAQTQPVPDAVEASTAALQSGQSVVVQASPEPQLQAATQHVLVHLHQVPDAVKTSTAAVHVRQAVAEQARALEQLPADIQQVLAQIQPVSDAAKTISAAGQAVKATAALASPAQLLAAAIQQTFAQIQPVVNAAKTITAAGQAGKATAAQASPAQQLTAAMMLQQMLAQMQPVANSAKTITAAGQSGKASTAQANPAQQLPAAIQQMFAQYLPVANAGKTMTAAGQSGTAAAAQASPAQQLPADIQQVLAQIQQQQQH